MKNVSCKLNSLLILLSILVLTGCSTPEQDRLRQEVEKAAEACPIEIAEGVNIEKISYDDNVVTYEAYISTPMISIETLKQHTDLIKPLLAKAVKKADNPLVNKELELCLKAGATLHFKLISADDSMTIEINPAELTD